MCLQLLRQRFDHRQQHPLVRHNVGLVDHHDERLAHPRSCVAICSSAGASDGITSSVDLRLSECVHLHQQYCIDASDGLLRFFNHEAVERGATLTVVG